MKKSKLGKGLETLIGDVSAVAEKAGALQDIAIGKIKQNPNQPRKVFDDVKLKELADSIREQGLLQPVVVQDDGAGGYTLIAGERRLRACKSLNWTSIKAVIRNDLEKIDLLELALIENIQRDDLNPMERAEAYSHLIDQYGLTQESVAKVLGKSRAAVANSVRLLTLPDSVQTWLGEGKLTEGHAKVLLQSADIALINKLAKGVIDEGLSVRALEQRMADGGGGPTKAAPGRAAAAPAAGLTPYVLEIQEKLAQILGTRVRIKVSKSNKYKGQVVIEFNHNDDFETIVNHIVEGDRPATSPAIRSFMT